MNKTIYKILNEIKVIGEKGMNEVFIGDVWEVDDSSHKYPLMIIDTNNKSHNYKNGYILLKADFYFVDLVKEDKSNELNTISDMVEKMKQFTNVLKNIEEEYRILFDSVDFQTFTDKWNDVVSGVKVSFNIQIDDYYGCKNIFN